MTQLIYQDARYACAPGETVLEALTRQGVKIPSACRSGVCQTCLMRALKGTVPAVAQAGLKPTQVAQGLFMACSCRPQEDLELALPDFAGSSQMAQVTHLETLNADIMAVRLRPHTPLDYRAGQFIRLYKDPQQSRCYSLASVPALDEVLEIHVRHVPGGVVSGWVHQELQAGAQVQVGGSSGQCFYVPGKTEQPLLLLGTGSGLAPLYGIVRDALHQGHAGPIWLYHGSVSAAGLYYVAALGQLQAQYPQFHYVSCVSGQPEPELRFGSVLTVALADHPELTGWRVFLCGNPDMIKNARMQSFLAGASMADIHADPFLPSGG